MTLIILTLLEVILVLVALVVFLFWKNRKLRTEIVTVSASGQINSGMPVVASDWLVTELQRTELRLAELSLPEQPNEDESHIAVLRQRFLTAERQAAVMGGDDDRRFWCILAEALSSIEATPLDKSENDDEQPLQVLPDLDEVAEQGKDESEVERLRGRVAILQERIASLEQFQAMFFDVKNKINSQQNLIERLSADLEQALASDGDLTILKATVEQLAYEKSDLQDQVASMSQQVSQPDQKGSITVEAKIPNRPSEPSKADSEQPFEPESTASRVETVNESSQHMSEEVEGMREVVNGQESRIQEMGRLIGELRLEVSDKDRLKQITAELEGRSIDLGNAVDRLEQENNFLQDQISTLLQQEISRDEQFTTELQRVQERLLSKEAAYSELEQKYADMEQQYLEVYSQVQQPGSS